MRKHRSRGSRRHPGTSLDEGTDDSPEPTAPRRTHVVSCAAPAKCSETYPTACSSEGGTCRTSSGLAFRAAKQKAGCSALCNASGFRFAPRDAGEPANSAVSLSHALHLLSCTGRCCTRLQARFHRRLQVGLALFDLFQNACLLHFALEALECTLDVLSFTNVDRRQITPRFELPACATTQPSCARPKRFGSVDKHAHLGCQSPLSEKMQIAGEKWVRPQRYRRDARWRHTSKGRHSFSHSGICRDTHLSRGATAGALRPSLRCGGPRPRSHREMEGGGVYAVPQPRWQRSIGEEMPKVRTARRAAELVTMDSMADVGVSLDDVGRHRPNEARPPRGGNKLILTAKQRGSTPHTGINAATHFVPIFTRERTLGTPLARHPILLWRQNRAPLFHGLFDSTSHGSIPHALARAPLDPNRLSSVSAPGRLRRRASRSSLRRPERAGGPYQPAIREKSHGWRVFASARYAPVRRATSNPSRSGRQALW